MLKTYLKIAWRNAINNKSYTFISLASLTLGITLFFFIAIWVKKELSYDKQFVSEQQLCRVETDLQMQDGSVNSLATVGWPVIKFLEKDYPEIEKVAQLRDWRPIISFQNEHFYEKALFADASFLPMFGYKLAEGNAATALTAPYSLVISKDMKQKYFGASGSAIGKVLMINDTIPYQVTGVFSDLSAPSHLQFDMLGSFSTFCAVYPETCKEGYTSGWFNVNMYNYVLLSKGTTVAAAQNKIRDLVKQNAKKAVEETGFKPTLRLAAVEDIYLNSTLPTGQGTSGNSKTVKLFLVIGMFILLIGCLNFINLSTAKSVERAKEIGIKKVLGSNKQKLVYQFITETGFLCIVSTIVSVVLMMLLLPVFNRFTGDTYTSNELFSTGNILLMATVLIILVPLAGFYPAWVLSSFKPITVLKGRFSHTNSGSLLRKGLVVTQFVISISFVMATMVVWKQMRFMQNSDLGFDKDKIMIADLTKVPGGLRYNNIQALKNELQSVPQIQMVTVGGAMPGRRGWDSQFAWPEGKPKDAQLIVEYIPVDENYVQTIGLELVAGRDFRRGSSVDSNQSFVINEAAVQLLGWKDAPNAIGKKLRTSGKDGQVIGVMKDYHHHGLQRKINPIVLGMALNTQLAAFRYISANPAAAIQAATVAWNKVFSGYEPDFRFMDEDFQRQYEKEKSFQDLFAVAAAASILIACMGLLGLTIYTAHKRIKEIGIRKVLGASTGAIVRLLSFDFIKLVLVAVALATPIAWWAMSLWLNEFAYHTELSWWVFAGAGLIGLVIAFATISVQAVRAAVSNPVKNLRTE